MIARSLPLRIALPKSGLRLGDQITRVVRNTETRIAASADGVDRGPGGGSFCMSDQLQRNCGVRLK